MIGAILLFAGALIAREPSEEGELPSGARELHKQALVALERGELERADQHVLLAYEEVDRTPADALIHRRGRDVLLATRRYVLKKLAERKDEAEPLCTLRTFLERHRDQLVQALGPSLQPGDLEGIHERIREVDQELGLRASTGKPAACSRDVPPAAAKPEPAPLPEAAPAERQEAEGPARSRPPAAMIRDSGVEVADRGRPLRRAGIAVLAASAIPLPVMIYGLSGTRRALTDLRVKDAELGERAPSDEERAAIMDIYFAGTRARTTAIVGGVVTAAALITGSTMLIVGQRRRGPEPERVLVMTPSFGGLSLSGKF